MWKKNDNPKFLNRFTTLPFVIDLLARKKLVLLNPSKWEDYNDRLTIEKYRNDKTYNSIYALCLTDKRETIHHWKTFANGTSGCCIEFNYEKLISNLNQVEGIKYGEVKYIKIKDLKDLNLHDEDLPFLKRDPFKSENEFRIIAASTEEQKETFEIDINLDSINRITFSNKMPKSTFETIKKEVGKISSEYKGKISRSTLFDNQDWANYFNKKL